MTKKQAVIDMIFPIYALIVFAKFWPLLLKNPAGGTFIIVAVILFPVAIYILYVKRKKWIFFESKNSLEVIRNLTPSQFEDFVCHLFDKLGYATERVGGPNDGGIDVIAIKNGISHYIQCKKFITQQVSVGAMRDFYGAIVDRLSNAKAFFITTNVFTMEAENFAMGKPIELIDGKKLMEYVKLAGLEKTVLTRPVFGSSVVEKCPRCGGQLVLRTAHKGPNAGRNFYGCSKYPVCKFTKNIE